MTKQSDGKDPHDPHLRIIRWVIAIALSLAALGAIVFLAVIVIAVVLILAVINSASNTCFVAGTLVETREGLKPIEQIGLGDEVFSWNEHEQRFEFRRVVRLLSGESTEVLVIQGKEWTLRCTSEHPFLLENGEWKKAKYLSERDFLKTNTVPVQITSINKEIQSSVNVFGSSPEFVGEFGVRCSSKLGAGPEAPGPAPRPPPPSLFSVPRGLGEGEGFG